jgi:inorganic pyrophosphatase
MEIIGKKLKVKIDRPLGTRHPKHYDLVYPINYGYVEDIFALDGEEQDCYVLGVDEPISDFEGVVIAIIKRLDDVEDKWVVAYEGSHYTDEEILKQVYFQEQYFHIKLIR